MIYLLGIDENKKIVAGLCSVFDPRLIKCTNIVHHWAGRNTRGVAQFLGTGLIDIINECDSPQVSIDMANEFLKRLIDR